MDETDPVICGENFNPLAEPDSKKGSQGNLIYPRELFPGKDIAADKVNGINRQLDVCIELIKGYGE